MGGPRLIHTHTSWTTVLKAPPSTQDSPPTHHDVTCPFCGLLCDDLSVRVEGRTIQPVANACPKALAAYAAATVPGEPRIEGKPVALERALAHAVRLLRRSRRPLIAGLGTDVAGLRAALALAEACHACVDHMHSAGLNLNLRVLQSRGWQTTTLSEVRNRADLVVLCGVDLTSSFRNFVPRVLAAPDALQPSRRASRRVAFVGPEAQAPTDTAGLPLDVVPAADADLAATLRALQALLAGRRIDLPRGRRRTALEALAARITAAEYAVFAWAPGQLAAQDGDLVIAAICETVADINRVRRAAGLVLGGDDGAQSALAVSSWLTGFPVNVSFAGARLAGAVGDASATGLLARGEADLLLYVTSFSRRVPPPGDVPQILLAPPGFAAADDAEVYLPIGVPGIDHPGQLLRTDGVVALPLPSLRPDGPPAAADLLTRLRAGLN